MLNDRDLVWLQKLQRHGPLSTSYLLEFTKDLRASDARQKDRLTLLFNEHKNPHGYAYLDRPWQQFDTMDARYHQLIYSITATAETALKQAELYTSYGANLDGSWKHTFMVACITASVELATLQTKNIRYIGQDEILERAQTRLCFPVTIDYDGQKITKELKPDGLFGLEYHQDGKTYYRFFLLEADRATEPTKAGTYQRKSYQRTILQYREFIGKGLYKDALKLNAGIVSLHVTTSPLRQKNIMNVVQKITPENNYLCFQNLPMFGTWFQPPGILYHLFTQPWDRVGAEPFYINRI